WGMTVAGSSVRYRRRVRAFHRVEMRGRGIGLDDKFMYVEQSIWRKGECCSHILLRIAVTNAAGIVPSAQVIEALGTGMELNALPDWVTSWSAAEAKRPWPPMGPAMEPPVQPQMDKIDAPV
ncbi:MAG: thioeseterase, partial [Mangrovicoccus sp.]